MDNSMSLILNGRSSILESQYYPPIELESNKNYVIGLTEFLTFNSIPNVDEHNNKFYVDKEIISIPPGSYEIEDIEKYLISQLENKNISLSLKVNRNTLFAEIKCNKNIDFSATNSIGRLLGFTSRLYEADTLYTSDLPVEIISINAIRVECNIATSSYVNDKQVHTIHQFYPSVKPGYKINEVPSSVIYLPINTKNIDHLELRIVDQEGCLINFRGEIITVRLHIKSI